MSQTRHNLHATPPLLGKMAGDERRKQILLVSVRLFSERGFRGTTTREIAQAAGVSEAIIFRHFATKEDLYNAILDHKICGKGCPDPSEIMAREIERGDDQAVFEGLGLSMLRQYEEDAEFIRLLLHSALEGHQLFEMFRDRIVREKSEFLINYISQRQRKGELRDDIDPKVVSRAFVGMIVHHSLSNLLFDKTRTLLSISNEAAANQFTRILLGGIAVYGNSCA